MSLIHNYNEVYVSFHKAVSSSCFYSLFIIFLVEKSLENVSHQKYIIGRNQNLLHNEARNEKINYVIQINSIFRSISKCMNQHFGV